MTCTAVQEVPEPLTDALDCEKAKGVQGWRSELFIVQEAESKTFPTKQDHGDI